MDPYSLAERVGKDERLEPLATALDARFPSALREGRANEVLRGSFLGHALHPPLTDVPMGMWVSATVLDVVGGGRHDRASQALTGLGLLAALPTIASGIAEWDGVDRGDRRATAAHAASNGIAATCYLVSFLAKRSGRSRLGRVAAVAGGVSALVGGYLGGHLAIGRGVGGGPRR